MNNGIIVEGGIGDVIERNLRVRPRQDRHRPRPVRRVRAERHRAEPGRLGSALFGDRATKPLADPDTLEPIFWTPQDNSVVGNVVEGSGLADLAMSAVATDLSIIDPTGLGNCFAGNTFTTSAPADIEALLPCEGEGSGGDYLASDLNVASWLDDVATAPPSVDYQTAPTPEPPLLDGMPDAATAPANPAVNMPPTVDLASITVPDKPAS